VQLSSSAHAGEDEPSLLLLPRRPGSLYAVLGARASEV